MELFKKNKNIKYLEEFFYKNILDDYKKSHKYFCKCYTL